MNLEKWQELPEKEQAVGYTYPEPQEQALKTQVQILPQWSNLG